MVAGYPENAEAAEEAPAAQKPPVIGGVQKPKRKVQKLTNGDRKWICERKREFPNEKFSDMQVAFKEKRNPEIELKSGTVSGILKQEDKWLSIPDGLESGTRTRSSKEPELEAALYAWRNEQLQNDVKVRDEDLRDKAREIAAAMGINTDRNNKGLSFSSGWLDRFKKRNRIEQNSYKRRVGQQPGSPSAHEQEAPMQAISHLSSQPPGAPDAVMVAVQNRDPSATLFAQAMPSVMPAGTGYLIPSRSQHDGVNMSPRTPGMPPPPAEWSPLGSHNYAQSPVHGHNSPGSTMVLHDPAASQPHLIPPHGLDRSQVPVPHYDPSNPHQSHVSLPDEHHPPAPAGMHGQVYPSLHNPSQVAMYLEAQQQQPQQPPQQHYAPELMPDGAQAQLPMHQHPDSAAIPHPIDGHVPMHHQRLEEQHPHPAGPGMAMPPAQEGAVEHAMGDQGNVHHDAMLLQPHPEALMEHGHQQELDHQMGHADSGQAAAALGNGVVAPEGFPH